MDAIQATHNGDDIENEAPEQSLYREASGLCNSYRNSEFLPHVGDQYQVEIPPNASKSAYLKLTEFPTDAIILPETPQRFCVGLPIPVVWTAEEVEEMEHQTPDGSVNSNGMFTKNAPATQSCTAKTKINQQSGVKGHLVPGSLWTSWGELEKAAFLVGLYIFGKDFTQVKKFVGCKKMEDIQSYYYGTFFRSARYQRWSECRKVRSRRRVFGQKIFTGLRQQELLSRLLPHVPEESKKNLLEVATTYGEGKMPLEDFVFSLKAVVGLNALVEAIAIGKGKQDLTGNGIEPKKSNHTVSIHPEIPIGKACSSLTRLEIIDFLTGGYRLSKARSSDLFWEAVWPRLLARGWHSEQPCDTIPATNRLSLVFLVPGIEKFSRRKLVKGNHYFDSVADVLNKVASDPALLELDIGADTGAVIKEENRQTIETNSKREDFPDQKRHCYLKPWSTDAIRFTVVDTSLANRGTNKVRELKSLPLEIKNISASQIGSEDSDGVSSEEAKDGSNHTDNLPSETHRNGISRSLKHNIGKEISCAPKALQNNASKCPGMTDDSGFTRIPVKIPEDRKSIKFGNLQRRKNTSKAPKCPGTADGSGFPRIPLKVPQDQRTAGIGDIQPRKTIKKHTSRRIKPGSRNVIAPFEQRLQLLISCDQIGPSCGLTNTLVSPSQEKVGSSSGRDEFGLNILVNSDPPQEMSSSTRFFLASSDISSKNPLKGNPCGAEIPGEKPQCCALFDLNVSPIPEDAESEASIMERENIHNGKSRQLEDYSPQSARVKVSNTDWEQPPYKKSRRPIATNRPPTAKALEALAAGYYSTTHKGKIEDHFPPLETSLSQSSRRLKSDVKISSENFVAGFMNIKECDKRKWRV